MFYSVRTFCREEVKMDADQCPRCGLPEGWTLRLKVRLVLVGFVLCFVLGYLFRWYAF